MRLAPTSSFQHVRLGDCGEIVTGSTPAKSTPEYWNGDIPFVTPAQLGYKKPVTSSTEFVTTSGAAKGRLLPEKSVLVCCIGSLGKIGVAGVPLISNQQINAIVFDTKKVDPRYGYFAASNLTPLLEHYAPSTTVKIVKKSSFANVEIPLPPLPEQKRIAAILDAADALRAKRRESLEQLDQLLQSTFLEMFGDPVTNPMGWDIRPLGELGTLDRGVSKHRPRNDPALLNGPHPLIQTGEVSNSNGYIRSFTSTYSDLGLKQSKMWPAGTLCITIAANIANTGILTFDACFPDSVVGFSSDERGRVEYVQGLFWFLREILERRAPQVAQKNINLKILRSLPVPFPSEDLQQRFATIVESIEQQKARCRAQLDELDTLFASLQSRAFNGEF